MINSALPSVDLPDEGWYCRKHGLQFILAKVPALIGQLALFELLLANDTFLTRAGYSAALGTLASPPGINIAIREIGAWCCFLSPAERQEAFMLAMTPTKLEERRRRRGAPLPIVHRRPLPE